jgi:hypothetical protein
VQKARIFEEMIRQYLDFGNRLQGVFVDVMQGLAGDMRGLES